MNSFRDLVNSIGGYLSKNILPLLVAIAVLFFFINLALFILNMSNEKDREQFKKYSINALIALFVMLAVWGVVGIFTQTFFHTNPIIPQLPTSDGSSSGNSSSSGSSPTSSSTSGAGGAGGLGGGSQNVVHSTGTFQGFGGGQFGGGAGGSWGP